MEPEYREWKPPSILTPEQEGYLGLAVFALLIAVALYAYFRPGLASKPDGARITDLEALYQCQEAIKLAAPAKATVPYSKNWGRGTEYSFSWPTGSGLTFSNAYGMAVDTSASCIVDGRTGRITQLSVSGKSVI